MIRFLDVTCRRVIRGLVRCYYSPTEVANPQRMPRSGPLLVAANHANSLLDPVLIGIATRRPLRFLAKAPLFDLPVLGSVLRAFGMVPAWRAQDDASQLRRNLASIDAAAEQLVQGEAVGIFPEGRSHDALRVEQVKSGVARMAVRAAALGAAGLKLVPVGINFERKEGFRTGVWIRVGEPIDVAALWEREQRDERRAARAIVQEVDRRLRDLVIHLDDPGLEWLLEDLEVLLPPDRRADAIGRLGHRKRVASALNHFRRVDPGRAAGTAARLEAFHRELAVRGLELRSPILRYRRWRLIGALAWHGAALVLGGIPALAGVIHHAVPWWLNRRMAARWQQGRSTVALIRLLVGLPLFVAWYAAVIWVMSRYFLPWVAWTWAAAMPWCGLLALRFQRRLRRVFRGAWNQFRLFFRGDELRGLRSRQEALRGEVADFSAEYARVDPPPARPESVPWQRRAWVAARWAMMLAVAAGLWTFVSWRFAGHDDVSLGSQGLNLGVLSTSTLKVMLDGDEAALRAVLEDLDGLEAQARAIQADFAAGRRSWFRQADNDLIRQQLLRYLNCRAALLRLVWKYNNHAGAPDEALRLRAFLVQLAAGSALYEASLKLVAWYDREPEARRKLNEPEPLWQIPDGIYDALRRNLGRPEHRRLLAGARETYEHLGPRFRELGLDGPAHTVLHERVRRAAATIEAHRGTILAASVEMPLVDAARNARAAAYRAQTLVSTWVGDTRVRAPRNGDPLIHPSQVRELRPRLQPGDILLERRNWYLSNAFLPGFWPHAALYVGTTNDLHRLGLAEDPRIRAHWDAFVRRDAQGHELVVIESVSEGVIFNSLEHSVGGADAAAFLRPNLPPGRLREAIARAFSHVGKPYDFEFDFFSTDKLVCTELVFRAYDGDLHFELPEVMGRRTLPALEIVRKFATERGLERPELRFVAFLDGNERTGRAVFRDEAALVESIQRPGLEWLQGLQEMTDRVK